MTYAVVIASKGACASKTRLRPVLAAGLRIRLAETMLNTAYCAARGAAGYSEIILVSPSARDVPFDVTLLTDYDEGLNAAFLKACEYAEKRGHVGVSLIPADLPLLRSSDLESLLHSGQLNGAAISTDRTNIGTNGLFLPLPLQITLGFEGESFERHLSLLKKAGIMPAVVKSEGLAFDVDDARDLSELREIPEFTFLSVAKAF